MNHNIRQSDIEALSAWLDGELPAAEAERMSRRVQDEPALAAACQELRAIDAALDFWPAPPPPADLARRIKDRAAGERRPRGIYRLVRWSAGVAAAAAVFVAALVWSPWRSETPAPGERMTQAPAAETGQVEEFVVKNFDFFQDYDVVVNMETLDEIERLEETGS
jgi:anti-sigma factor RsiW